MKAKVPYWNNLQKYVTVDTEATKGATIGRDVFNADGSLFIPASASEPPDTVAVTLWRLVLEIPPNVKALELATGAGLFAVTGSSTGAFRTLQPVVGETTATNGDGVVDDPAIGLADVSDNGTGTLLAIDRDAKGRVEGTRVPTTTDLAEGSNPYFTDARAVNALETTGPDYLALYTDARDAP